MPAELVRARGPGRVNLLGEHTDYNQGLCLPFAIEAGITVAAAPLRGRRIEAQAVDLGEADAFGLDDVAPAPGWRAFVRGATAELAAAGHAVPGARLEIGGDLPRGGGLSSSAALEAALCLALLSLAGEDESGIDRVALARLCSRIEHRWVGARTGLLDQLAVLAGRAGHALRLDLRDLDIRPVPLALAGWTAAVLDSASERRHAESGYNERRRECEEACRLLGVRSLRAATPEDARRLPDPLDRRVRHVLAENERVDRAVEAIGRGDLAELADLLDRAHASLRDDYEVSVPAVERTIARAKLAGAAGARIMGGGFGGAVLALFPPGAVPPDDAVVVRPSAGARLC